MLFHVNCYFNISEYSVYMCIYVKYERGQEKAK